MLWALLAAFLRRRPPWAQAVVFGLCTGLFVAASATDLQRIARIGPVTFLVLGVGVVTGGAFHLALCAHLHSAATARPRALWVHVGNAAVWPLFVSAAVRALLGAGGSRLAVPAVVPIAL